MASYLLIVNPVAGKGQGLARAKELQDRLEGEHSVRLVQTTGRGSATELAGAVDGEIDRVIAVGGDGTLNEVLTGLLRGAETASTRPALGFLSGGTANVASRAFGFPSDPAQLAHALTESPGRPVDVGVARIGGEERPFLLWCGAGVDAVVIDVLNSTRTGHMGLKGLVLNGPRVLGAVARYSAPAIRVTTDHVALDPARSVIVANVGEIAFGGAVHTAASPFDGRVDVVTIGSAGVLDLMGLAVRLAFSSLTSAGGVGHRLATAVELDTDGRVPVQVDGEPAGHLPVTVRMEQGAIRLLVP